MVYKIKIKDPISNQILYFTTNWYVIENNLIYFYEQKNNNKESWNSKYLINIEERDPYPEAKEIKLNGIQITVSCPHCLQKHLHGIGEVEKYNLNQLGPRVPHCTPTDLQKVNIPQTAQLCQYRLVRK